MLGGGETLLFKRMMADKLKMKYCPDIRTIHQFVKGKETKEYWRRQAFDGGRSFIRMNYFTMNRKKILIHSIVKMVLRMFLAFCVLQNRFIHEYHARAYYGRIYELLAMRTNNDLIEEINWKIAQILNSL